MSISILKNYEEDSFPDKIKEARCSLGLSQGELSELVGVSKRSVAAYEIGEKRPREKTIYQLAKALHVSIKYLKDELCEDPTEDIEKDLYRDIERMLAENTALFAGGELSQAEKDTYFQALAAAYETCRETAKEKFGKKEK